ncbi:sensor histidine kinase [Pseudooceanicola sp. MF1-13]|uniref:sensor histidine kinase n=1 Tax=Pseudooceanicola sp. MF1-13 TaxID=3379095 RepID=UPI0038918E17
MSARHEGLAQAIDDQRAAEIFSASSVAFVLTDPTKDDNPIIYVNRAFEKLTGYAAEAAVGRNCRFLQHEGTTPVPLNKLRDAIESHKDAAVVVSNQRADGSVFLNALVVTPIFGEGDPEGAPPRYFLGMQRQVEADKEADQLAAFETNMAEVQHRVKNHLAMILGLIRLKARQLQDTEALNDLSRRIESLQLLYEEMSSAKRYGNEDTIHLGAYIGRVANAISHLDGRAGVRMNIDVAAMEVATDKAARIGLVVSEILTNAMQHAFVEQETGLVEIRVVKTNNDNLRITISDDGIGIPDDVNWPFEGGLGSRIVMGLIDGLGGSISVTRAAHGTVIVFDVTQI